MIVSATCIIFLPTSWHIWWMSKLSKRKNIVFFQSLKNKYHTACKAVFIVFAWQGHNLTEGRGRNLRNMGLGACSWRTYNLKYCEKSAKTYALDRGYSWFLWNKKLQAVIACSLRLFLWLGQFPSFVGWGQVVGGFGGRDDGVAELRLEFVTCYLRIVKSE